ncbi:Hypothetical protein CINCED_3A024428 [Cinara cedri]|uniref:Uncharacterized protein n=1 Tax=Cinara cedri TaxID=506608 RepID=A0A5E4ME28_9HEMI|nr:Hypothetical protein CINCED_3A024428 [Cinara cedri]
MERWFITGSVRPEKKLHSEHVVHSSILESTIPDVDIRKGSKKRKYCESYLDMGYTEFADGRPHCYQTLFKSKPISELWAQLGEDRSILSSKAKLLLLHFGTTYLCETAFSRYTATKTKYRSRLDAENDMRLQLTSVTPDIDKLGSKKQAQCSH